MKIAKRLYYIVSLIILLSSPAAYAQWTTQVSSTIQSINDVIFLDGATGWAVADSGIILHTSDGGNTWTKQTSPTTNALNSIHFMDTDTGYTAGLSGTVLKTTDGGATWNALTTGESQPLYRVISLDGTNAWATGGTGAMIYSSDGGLTWGAQSGSAENIYGLFFTSNTNGFTGADYGDYYVTTNSGGTWSSGTTFTSNTVRDIFFIDASTGWAVVEAGEIYKTTNGGSSWTAQTSNTAQNIYGVHFYDANNGWFVGAAGTTHRTTDGGATWTSISSGNSNQFNSVHVVNPDTAFMVGPVGAILKWTNTPAPDIDITAGPLNFPDTEVNGSEVMQIAVRNVGNINLNVSNVTVPAGFNNLGPTSFVVIPNDSVILDIEFAPTSNITYSGRVYIYSDDADEGTVSVDISGLGYNPTPWSLQTSGTSSNLNTVFFGSRQDGIAAGDAATIITTSDGGATYGFESFGSGEQINDIAFGDVQNLWAVGSGGVIKRSPDMGTTWNPQTSGTSDTLFTVHFQTPAKGWAAGSNGTMLFTADAGATWTTQTSNISVRINDLFFIEEFTGWGAADAGKIINTTDGGSTWSPQTTGITENLKGIYFANLNEGWAVGENGTILHTTNGGTNWSPQSSGVSVNLNAVRFIDILNGWAVGQNGIILHTGDGGASWNTEYTGITNELKSINFYDQDHGWAAGTGGAMLHYYIPPHIVISMIDTTASANDTLLLPISFTGALLEDSVISFQMGMQFPGTDIEVLDVISTGFLLDNFSYAANIFSDSVIIAGAMADPLTSSGTLCQLKVAIGPAFGGGDSLEIAFGNFSLNEGEPLFIAKGCKIYFPTYYGDVSQNLEVTAFDASLLLQHVVFITTLNDTALVAADVSGNGTASTYDAALILQYVASLITDFPAGKLYVPPKTACANSFASLSVAEETERTITYAVTVHEQPETFAYYFSFDMNGLEYESTAKSSGVDRFLMECNMHNGLLHIGLAGIEPVSGDAEIVRVTFRKTGDASEAYLASAMANESLIRIEDSGGLLPREFQLYQNYPNPFNPVTTIRYALPKAAHVTLKIYNILGQEVATLVNQEQTAAYHTVKWDGRNSLGINVTSGVYIYTIKAGKFIKQKKLVLLK